MPDYPKLVKAKEELEGELRRRMDDDVRLRDLMRYVLDDERRRAVSGIVNVTLNRPAVFYANIFAALNNAHENIIVESEIEDFDTHYIEDFRRAGFKAADTRLRMQGRPRVDPFIDEQSCIRGRAAALVVFEIVNGVLRPTIRTWDTRYVTRHIGDEGLEWAAFHGERSMDLIMAQYSNEIEHFGVNNSKKTGKVLDVWHKTGNEVWINGTKIFEQPHNFGFTPVVFDLVTLGSMLSDEDALERTGESIYFLIRGLIPELNRLASIVATQTQTTVKPPIQSPSKSRTDEAPDYDDVMNMGDSSSSGPEGFTQVLQAGDVGRAAGILLTLVDTALQEGSLSSSDLGILGSPPPSGITLIQIKEGRDQVFAPRLELKSSMKLGIGDMFTKQIIQIGGSVELDNRTFEVSKLEGQYQVKHEFNVRSRAIDAGLASLAVSFGNLISEKEKLENIIQFEDPKGDADQKRWEEAELLSPLVKLRRTVESLEELGADEDAKLMVDEAEVQLDKLLAGEVEERKPTEPQEPKQVVSLFGGQSGRPQQQPMEEV